MTDFETAARKAGAEIIDAIDNDKPGCFHEIITKHYADLAETFGLLCELARATMGFSLCAEVGNLIKMKEFSDDITRILSNPRIAALLAEKKG